MSAVSADTSALVGAAAGDSMTTSFERAVALTEARRDHRGGWAWQAALDPTWASLLGIHGGYMTAIAVGAFEAAHPHRTVRTVHASFLRAAVAGPVDVELRTRRDGTSTTTAEVLLAQSGREIVSVSITGRSAAPGAWTTVLDDGPVTREACIPFDPPPGIPLFAHVDCVLDPADVPFTSGARARIAGHVRSRERRPIDARWLTMLLDWFPPSTFSRYDRPSGGLSLDYTVHLHHLGGDERAASDGRDWLAATFEAHQAAGGLALEHGRIADASGAVLAESFHSRLLGRA